MPNLDGARVTALADQTLETYLDRLASADAVPGGGAAVAVTAAQAAALLSMVIAITDKERAKPETREAIAALARARARFLELGTEDGQAFGAVMDVYKLANTTDAEKRDRKTRLQSALKGAAAVPLTMLEELNALHPIMRTIADAAKPSIASDAALAVQLVDSAMKGAMYNVRINLRYLDDLAFRKATLDRLQRLTVERRERRKALMKKLTAHF